MASKMHGFATSLRVFLAIAVCHSLSLLAAGQSPAPFSRSLFASRIAAKDPAGNVVSLDLMLVTDEEVESYDFSKYPMLKWFSVSSSYVTNRSFLHLRRLPPGLKYLEISDAKATDKELVPLLQELKSLRRVSFLGREIEINERTMLELSKLEYLSSLKLTRAKVTESALGKLHHLEGLRSLCMSETGVTDRGLRAVKKLDLSSLNLAGTKITDAGLRELATIENLDWLDISNTQVSDDGILHLGGLENLRKLNVSSSKVTDKGKAALKSLLPDLEFVESKRLQLFRLEDFKFGS